MSAYRLDHFLDSTPLLHRLARQAARLEGLHRDLEKLLPPELARATQVGGLTGGILTLIASNGTVAAKLRQMRPSMTAVLSKRAAEVTAIRVEVQAALSGAAPARAPKSGLSASGGKAISALADSLEEGDLRDALEKLARRAGSD